MESFRIERAFEWLLLLFLSFAIIWKGGKTLESTWALSCIGFLCSCLIMKYQWEKRQSSLPSPLSPVLLWILLLYLFFIGSSYIASTTKNYGLDEVLRSGGLVLILLWILTMTDGAEALSAEGGVQNFTMRFVRWMAAITFASCWVGIAVYVLQPVNRFVGTFFDYRFHTDYWPNAFADFLLIGWPLAAIAFDTYAKPFRKWGILSLSSTGLIIGCLFLTYSRGGILAFGGQIILLCLLLLFAQRNRLAIARTLVTTAILLVISLCTFLLANTIRSQFHAVQDISDKVTFQSAEGLSSVNERSAFWSQAIALTSMRPLLGWGPYSFRFVQPRMQESPLATSDHPHNVFLKLSSEMGIPAALLFSILILWAFFSGISLSRSGKRLPRSSDHGSTTYPLLTCSLAGVIAHNLIDYNLQFVGIALPLWIIMGILLRQRSVHLPMGKTSKRMGNRPSHIWAITGITLTLCASLGLITLTIREGYYLFTSSLGRHAEVSGNEDTALRWYDLSQPAYFSRDLRLSATRLLWNSQRLDEALSELEGYIADNDQDSRAWSLLGALLRDLNRPDDALAAFRMALKLGGWNDLSISRGLLETSLALSYEEETSPSSSADPLLQALLPDIERRVRLFGDAIMVNHHFIALSPNVEEFSNLLTTLSILLPDKAEEFRRLSTRVTDHALSERAVIRARPPGFLW